MAFAVNPELVGDLPVADEQGKRLPPLPPGVYREDEEIPENRVELFRVNGRRYTLPKTVDPRVVFRFMRAIRRAGKSDLGQVEVISSMLYEVLGDATVDALADEDLAPDELEQVMGAITKYTMSAFNRAGLGN